MSERKQQMAHAAMLQYDATVLLMEAEETAILLYQQSVDELAALSNQEDDAQLTRMALTGRMHIETLQKLLEIQRQAQGTAKQMVDQWGSEASSHE
jgi:hypothetical protein